MSDIDFLANQPGDDQKRKNQNDKKEKIIWSKPDEDKPLVKEAPFSVLSFFGKKKDHGPDAEQKPIIDKNKIRKSRREILKLIKRHKDSGPEETKQPRPGLLAGLLERLKKSPSHKEVLIDYQQVFNQEKIKRSPLADRLSASKFFSPTHFAGKAAAEDKPAQQAVRPSLAQQPVAKEVSAKSDGRTWDALKKPTPAVRPTVENKPVAELGFKDSFFSRLLKMIKAALANRPKPRPPKINLVEIPNRVKPAIVQPPLIKSALKEEKAIKKKPLEPEKPAQIGEEPREVLETNLIKGEIITFFDWPRKIIILINAIFIPVLVIAASYLGLMYYQKQNQAKVQEQIKRSNELTAEIKQAEIGLKEISEFQAKLKTVSQIFARHIYWTNLFKFLEDNTIKDVYYTGFSGDTSGIYSLDAVGAKFGNISEQVGVFRNNEKIAEVLTLGGEAAAGDAADKNGVKFNINLSILKSIFTE